MTIDSDISTRYGRLAARTRMNRTMSELYSRMEFELERRLDEAEKVGVGFSVPTIEVAPSALRNREERALELVA
jgi:hypothetical protein